MKNTYTKYEHCTSYDLQEMNSNSRVDARVEADVRWKIGHLH